VNHVHWLSPGDPTQRTGGYLYNARIGEALVAKGISVKVLPLTGPWPRPDGRHTEVLASIPDGAVVVADGLLWPGLHPDERERLTSRCVVWVVVHSLMDLEQPDSKSELAVEEARALKEAHGCFATSLRTATILQQRMGGEVPPVVMPGTAPVPPSPRPGRNQLLAVGHLIHRKGYEHMLEALAKLTHRSWRLDVVGSLERDPAAAHSIVDLAAWLGLLDRVRFVGELDDEGMEQAYRQSDALIHGAHFEAYGMVLTEALARGLPVLSTPAGALDGLNAECIRVAEGGAWGSALDEWLSSPERLTRAQESAAALQFPGWAEQGDALIRLLGLDDHGFSVEWLRMREPYDHGARSRVLASRFASALLPGPSRVMELASGLGSGARFLSQFLPETTEWTLVDHDPRLLAATTLEMARSAPGLRCTTLRQDLHALEEMPFDADAVSTQALLDLVSEGWLERFADWLAAKRVPLLAALSVNGRVQWLPSHSSDEPVSAAFQHHQTWDRGFGHSVGVESADRLARMLSERGFEVEQSETVWHIPAEDQAMVGAMVEGIANAAGDAATGIGIAPSLIAEWRETRRSQLGSLSLEVGHFDLLAIPR
jgi:glycosyltransferase involved in cell wall biosynthesis